MQQVNEIDQRKLSETVFDVLGFRVDFQKVVLNSGWTVDRTKASRFIKGAGLRCYFIVAETLLSFFSAQTGKCLISNFANFLTQC